MVMKILEVMEFENVFPELKIMKYPKRFTKVIDNDHLVMIIILVSQARAREVKT